jgi:uncharacterized membrane protein YphA (DoxX/SURF4 family)
MQDIIQYHSTAAIFIARMFLGSLFFFQGMDAVFGVKVRNVVEAVRGPMAAKGVPSFVIRLGAYFTSYVQLFGGAFLLLGLFRYCALYVLGLDLLIAGIGFGIAAPLWDTKHVLPRLVLLIFLLLIPATEDLWSLDSFIFRS